MKVVFDCRMPCMLAHGGMQIQIDQTLAALKCIGVDAEPLRWWDANQKFDVLHYFGRVPFILLEIAHQKGVKVVMSDFLGEVGARPRRRIEFQRAFVNTFRNILTPSRVGGLNWESYRQVDACIALTPWEAHLMSYIFDAPAERTHVVLNGVEDVFFQSAQATRGEWLVCTATIRNIKRNYEVAAAAVEAKTPIWMIGKPYGEGDAYAQKFLALAKQHPKFVRYEGPIDSREQMARVYREARGFVLLSMYESLSLSALEAAACQCPLLLSDLPWAKSVFKEGASFCSPTASQTEAAAALRRFYDDAPNQKLADTPLTWTQVAEQLAGIYRSILKPR
jgi:glycosyltransferase involved in cell wall biosynthesis